MLPAGRDPRAPVAMVLVNWNGADDTLATLDSLVRARSAARGSSGAGRWRIWLVDNGSTDDSVQRFRRRLPELASRGLDVGLVETGENLGFAGGNLVGIQQALGEQASGEGPEEEGQGAPGWVLLLNTDVEVDPEFLEPLVEACLDPEVGAAGPKIFYADPADRLWAAGGRLRLRESVTEEHGRGRPDGPRWNRPRDVTYLTTCCLLIPRDALERVGPPDPLYFINGEDADWCRRALDAGYRLRYVPESRLWHKVAASTGGSYTPFKTFHTGRSNALYVRRHHGPAGMAVFLAANALALAAAFLRELPRGNAGAVLSKARGLWRGLRDPLPPPPQLRPSPGGASGGKLFPGAG